MASDNWHNRTARKLGGVDRSQVRVAIIRSQWHRETIVDKLADHCDKTLRKHKVGHVEHHEVPGSYELPQLAALLAAKGGYHAIITLGCIIKGETDHNDYIAHAVAKGLTDISLQYKLPVVFGVVTTNTLQQAIDRTVGPKGEKGMESALTALQMIDAYAAALHG